MVHPPKIIAFDLTVIMMRSALGTPYTIALWAQIKKS